MLTSMGYSTLNQLIYPFSHPFINSANPSAEEFEVGNIIQFRLLENSLRVGMET